ncbi:uncharacterized protein LOC124279945 [Haliotis rubra]|uniref:uncharacterized protein LOC124279945 n=1 Tax=Haliotis rubra TaxID=36100 RepID=UPI001EE6283D|nr:uncharacterized protein LOC124279945 [Haliotis rubra]
MADEKLIRAVDEISIDDSDGRGSTTEWTRSPIIFKALDETDDDVVSDTETVDGARQKMGLFGALLATRRDKHGDYCHRLQEVEEKKWTKLRAEDELRYINQIDVSSWDHYEVLESIRHLRGKITFTFFREHDVFEKSHMMRTENSFVEITFIIANMGSDGKGTSIDDIVAHIVDVTYKFCKLITYKSSLTVMKYLDKACVKVAHGVHTRHFLCALQDKAVMERQRGDIDSYKFWMYSWAVNDSEDDHGKNVVAFQSVRRQRFLMCNMTSKKLSLVKKNIDPNLRIMKSNSPCLFLMTLNGSNETFLESVAYDGLFVSYDDVDELELSRKDPQDRSSDDTRATFAFQITPSAP